MMRDIQARALIHHQLRAKHTRQQVDGRLGQMTYFAKRDVLWQHTMRDGTRRLRHALPARVAMFILWACVCPVRHTKRL